MTCEDVRSLATAKPFEDTTRAERAAVLAHVLRCPECEEFLESIGPHSDPQGEAEVLRNDLEDDEFREVLG